MKRSSRTRFALFQKYKCGTNRRAGPPCSGASGTPLNPNATHAFARIRSASGTFVVYPPSLLAITYGEGVIPFAAPSDHSVAIEISSHAVPNVHHYLTQWMSVVTAESGRALNSSPVQRTRLPSAPCSEKSQ